MTPKRSSQTESIRLVESPQEEIGAGRALYANLPFAGKVALVTGGTLGIGLATAIAFADAGAAHVVVCGRNRSKWDVACAIIADTGIPDGVIEYVQADVRVEDQVERLVAHVYDEYGRMDACVNNAGVYPTSGADITEVTFESCVEPDGSILYRLPPLQPLSPPGTEGECPVDGRTAASSFCENPIATTIIGTLYCLKHEIRAARERQPDGIPLSIVNLASRNATVPEERILLYASSKSFVLGITHAVAGQTAIRRVRGQVSPLKIRVNAVSPGPTVTPLMEALGPSGMENALVGVPMDRYASPAEIAQTILFLSDESRSPYTTGANFAVDGGATAMPAFRF